MENSKWQEELVDIKGMHCSSCVELIKSKLMRLKGVEKVDVSLVEEKAFVRFDPNRITLETIKEEIVNMGYSVDEAGKTVDNKSWKSKRNTSLLQGILYGLVPHTGCIAFIIATILGVTVAVELFKPLLMNPYFFYILIAISFVFATISSLFYLKKQGFIRFNRDGAGGLEMTIASNTLKRKWKYLSTMYGTTIFINIFLFLIVFPALANINSGTSITGSFVAVDDSLSTMTLQVAIPCPGHAPLISGELKKVNGVKAVRFRFPNLFDVSYDSPTASKEKILSLDVFNVYKPTVLEEAVNQDGLQPSDNDANVVGSCCGSTACGAGSGGGCGCGG